MGANQTANVSSGVMGLDEILCGGFPKGHTYLVEGNPGTGKTTLAMQFLMAGRAAGEKCLYFTLSETKAELHQVAASHGWDLAGIEIVEIASEGNLDTPSESTFFHTSELELSQTNRALLSAYEKLKPKRVVLDSLSELKLLAIDPVKFRRQLMALKRYFSDRDTTVFLLDDKVQMSREQEIQSIVHGVVSLEQLAPGYGGERRRIRVRKLRGVAFRNGYHDFSLRTGGMVVFPRLVASQHGVKVSGGVVNSGIHELDELWGGHLDRATSTLLMGPAGSGKSTVAIKYAEQCAKSGEQVNIFLFDEATRTLQERSMALGIDLEPHIKSGLLNIREIDPAEVSPGEFMMIVREAVNNGASMVIIDSLNGYINAMPEERFLVIQMHELLSYLRRVNVTAILVLAQHGLLGGVMDNTVDVSYLADNVLLLRYFEAKGAVNQAISVVKRRGGNHERTIRELKFSPKKGIMVGPPLTNFQGILTGIPELLPDAKKED